MQIQKEEVRNRIIEAAKQEFLRNGYRRTSMRTIAEQAGVTPGNIYAYFRGKADLLDVITRPTLEELNRLIAEVSKGARISKPTILEMAEQITAVFLNNRTQFLILMNGCGGSKYEQIREQICLCAVSRMEEELLPVLPVGMQSKLLIETMANALISGFFYLFDQYQGEEAQLRRTMMDFMMITLYHIQAPGGEETR